MKRKNAPRVHFSLLVLCYLEVVLWTACLLTSSTTLPSEALAGQGYLQRETGNLKNLIQVSSASPSSPAGSACPAFASASPAGSGGSSCPSAASPRGTGRPPSSSSSPFSSALSGGGWPLHARELLAGERHYHLERVYLRRVLATWAALGFLPSASRLLKAAGGGGPLRPTPDATGLPAPFAGIKAID